MKPLEFSALEVVSSNLSLMHVAEDDAVVVFYSGEQLFSIERVTAKGCPTYSAWQMEAWVFENYVDSITQFISLREVI